MNQTKTYTMPIGYWILLGLGAFVFVVAQIAPVPSDLKIAPGVFTLGIAIVYLTALCKIEMDEHNHIVLSGAFKKIQVDAADIIAIEYGARLITLKHRNGKIGLTNWGASIEEFLRDLKQRNPTITEEYGVQFCLGRNRTFMILLAILSVLVPLILVALILVIQNGGRAK